MSKQRRRYSTNFLQFCVNPEVVIGWRLGKELSQREAAKFVGLSPVTYNRAEHGKPILALSAAKLAHRLKIPLEELRATMNGQGRMK